jgi:hypothetical protein
MEHSAPAGERHQQLLLPLRRLLLPGLTHGQLLLFRLLLRCVHRGGVCAWWEAAQQQQPRSALTVARVCCWHELPD